MFGVRDILLIALACVLATPLMANSKTSEGRAALGTIKDRLRVKYVQNNNTLDAKWTFADLVNLAELDGDLYDRSNYGLFVRSVKPPQACIYCLANPDSTAPQLVLEITNVQTGEGKFSSPGQLPEGVSGVVSDSPELDAARAERIRVRARELLNLKIADWAVALVPFLLFVLAALSLFFGRRSQRAAKFSAWFAAAATGIGFWTGLRPDYEFTSEASTRGLLLLVAAVGGFVLLIVALIRSMQLRR